MNNKADEYSFRMDEDPNITYRTNDNDINGGAVNEYGNNLSDFSDLI